MRVPLALLGVDSSCRQRSSSSFEDDGFRCFGTEICSACGLGEAASTLWAWAVKRERAFEAGIVFGCSDDSDGLEMMSCIMEWRRGAL